MSFYFALDFVSEAFKITLAAVIAPVS